MSLAARISICVLTGLVIGCLVWLWLAVRRLESTLRDHRTTRNVIARFIACESGWPVNAGKVQELTDTVMRQSQGSDDMAMVIAVDVVGQINREIDERKDGSL